MSILRTISLLSAAFCLGSSLTQAGIFSRSCGDSCSESCCEATCCPSDYCCVGDCKNEAVKLKCFESKTDPVCIPPVKFPCGGCCFSKLCGRGKCGSCSGCGDGSCNTGCDSGCGKNSLISKLFGKFAKCRVRCVNTYSKKEYECGSKCVCTWKAVRKGGCDAGCGTGCCE